MKIKLTEGYKSPTPQEFLDSKIIDWSLEDGFIALWSDEYEDVQAELCTEYFDKEVWDNKGFDPTEVYVKGEFNIRELRYIDRDYRDEWDLGDICEVFYKNKEKIQIREL